MPPRRARPIHPELNGGTNRGLAAVRHPVIRPPAYMDIRRAPQPPPALRPSVHPGDVLPTIVLVDRGTRVMPTADMHVLAREVVAHADRTPSSESGCIANKGFTTSRRLGQGAYGTVYSACRGANCSYAVKMVFFERNGLELLDTLSTSFLAEAMAMSDLSSRGVTPGYYGAFTCKYGARAVGILVMELMDGDLLKAMRIKFAENIHNPVYTSYREIDVMLATRKWFGDQIERMLKIAGTKRWLHMDLKSANVLYKSDPNTGKYDVRISDWGLAIHYNKRGKAQWGNYYTSRSDAGERQYDGYKIFQPYLDLLVWEHYFDRCALDVARAVDQSLSDQNPGRVPIDFSQWTPYRVELTSLSPGLRDQYKHLYTSLAYSAGGCKDANLLDDDGNVF